MNKETITVGLIRGRHPLPVSNYIFNDAIVDVHDYMAINDHIYDFLNYEVGIDIVDGVGLNQYGTLELMVYSGRAELVVYVTGLTCVTAALVAACAMYGVKLTLMNYDSVSGTYIPQRIF